MITPNSKNSPIKWVPVRDILVLWPEAQRKLSRTRVETMVRDFNPDFFGVLVVSKPIEGKYHCVDGQHRTEAARRVLGDDQLVPCLVVDVADAAEAAKVFVGVNSTQAKPTAIDTFKVAAESGAYPYKDIARLVESIGYRVYADNKKNSIRSVQALLTAWDLDGAGVALFDALVVIRSVWPKETAAVDGAVMLGFARFLHKCGGDVDRTALAKKIAQKYTSASLLAAARSAKAMFKDPIPATVSRLIEDAYNSGRRITRVGSK